MRRIHRPPLPDETLADLDRRQERADSKHAEGALNPTAEWKAARQTKPLGAVLDTLRAMAGARVRCMYCHDSHGGDIEHFWPKAPYPDRMFRRPNLLLCCTDCGRHKGDKFPLADGLPLLIDPTADNPWDFLEYDTETNSLVARFDVTLSAPSPQGSETVRILKLDRREAVSKGYHRTFKRLKATMDRFLKEPELDGSTLLADLQECDDHGLLGWFTRGTGRNDPTAARFRETFPETWILLEQMVA